MKFLPKKVLFSTIIIVGAIGLFFLHVFLVQDKNDKFNSLKSDVSQLTEDNSILVQKVSSMSGELTTLQDEDQTVKNKKLQDTIKNMENVYKKSVSVYENLLSLKDISKKTDKFDKLYASVLSFLSKDNYASASAVLNDLDNQLITEKGLVAQASTPKIDANVASFNTPPSSGYRRQQVTVDGSNYVVDIITADLNSTRIIVDTASDSDCKDNCPVLSLGDYVARSGAYAGINGSYFCPASYPTCAGKTNSYDTLLMNKKKTYFNSDNNVYSTVPAAIFQGNSVRFIGQSLEWGRDTGVDGVIANYPLLISGGQVAFGSNSETKQGVKSVRGFVGSNGNMAYIGIVHNATMAEAAKVLQSLGMQGALNLDSGGSTALWFGGYKAGPGRNIPNAILFVKK